MTFTSKIQKWQEAIEEVNEDVVRSFNHLDSNLLEEKDGGAWSISEILQHLIQVNESYFEAIRKIRIGEQKLPFSARFPFISRLLGKAILKSVQPTNQRKTTTFNIWQPHGIGNTSDIIPQFLKSQDRLKDLIDGSEDLLRSDVIIVSPANKMIFYRLETAFDIIIAHEKRHVQQAKSIIS